MATRQQRRTKPKSRSHAMLFWLLFVIVLIGLVFYFGFIKVD
jgi:capsule polysaccharide export protein KpsE/RkpR